jgi:hypothetical protein
MDLIKTHIPETFYAELPDEERLKMLIKHWQRAIKVNQELEEKISKSAGNAGYAVACRSYLYELQKRYIEIKEGFQKYPYDFVVTDEMYLIGKILEIYGVQKDKLPLTVEKFVEASKQSA